MSTYIEDLEDRLKAYKIKVSPAEINKVIEENKKLRVLQRKIDHERTWHLPDIRNYLAKEKQMDDGNIYSVFYSEINGERRYFVESVTGLQGFRLIKEADREDAERFSRFLLNEPEMEPESTIEVEIIEKGETHAEK